MSRRLRNQDGFSLPEVLIAMMIMLVVMTATLASLDGYRTRQRLDERRSEAQESLRRGVDHLERQLRNLATPVSNVKSIHRAQPADLVFQTADPQKRWVRYCSDAADPGIASGQANLYYQVSSDSTSTPPTGTSCPASGWSSQESIGQAVVNARDGLARPLFAYNWPRDAAGSAITSDTAAITHIRTDLWVDTNPGADPPEQRLSSGVFLRNQNQEPVPGFTWTSNGHGVVLNASSTTDFEGRRLNYHWYYGSSPAIPTGCKPPESAPASYLGSGIVLSAEFPLSVSSPQTVTLCVVDPGDLQATLSKPVTFS
ncbi:MAG TPA: prepilin-type N-terminal cleavage/methylation domain-containing protein [Solirubrobacteraceae bacterium]|nr:prepilin-type N-terminal cleavage/methylation domain-containing protein [Solirubrobacteraceae bacterium]